MKDAPELNLAKIGERLRAQDNRITADPIFLVQERKRQYGMDTQYDPAIAWIYADDPVEADKATSARLEKKYQKDGKDEREGFRRVGYFETWEYVQPFFTEVAADEYIARMSHRHRGPLRTYVDSAYRNYEWQAVRNYLMEVRPADSRDPGGIVDLFGMTKGPGPSDAEAE